MSEIAITPTVLSRDEHELSRNKIDPDALKVMYRLIKHGYKAYLVGGGVRDLLLNKEPKDFDVGTDAKPEVVRKLFRNSRIIGRRFRINHVYFKGNKIIEVTTFRALLDHSEEGDGSLQPVSDDNEYGDACSDALRRDLTINGLFYDLSSYSIIDYVGGVQDLEDGIVRIIGDPDVRIQEDPVRIIRVVRHAARTGFEIEPKTRKAVSKSGHLLELASPARMHEEIIRDLTGGWSKDCYSLMLKNDVLKDVIPFLDEAVIEEPQALAERLNYSLGLIDEKIKDGEAVTPAFAFACLLVGNLFSETLDTEDDPELDEIIPLFEVVPAVDPKDFSKSKVEAMLVKKREERNHRTRGRVKREPLNPFRTALRDFILPIRLTRKELSGIEMYVSVRAFLIANSGNEDLVLSDEVLTSKRFGQVLDFIRCTAHDPVVEDAYEYWQGRRGDAKPQRAKKSSNRPRKTDRRKGK